MDDGHAYSHFALALRAAFQELGHEAVVSDQSAHVVNGQADPNPLARELQAGRFDAAISFSSFFGGVLLSDGVALFDALGVKFVGWQLDHPIYAPQSLGRALKGRYGIYCNDNHLRFTEAIRLPGRGVAMLPGANVLPDPPTAFADRPWGVFVAATCNGRPQSLWEQLEDSPGKRLLVAVLERLSRDREASLLDAFNDASARLRLGAKLGVDPAFDDQMIGFLREPLTYLRHLDRIAAIQAIAEAGLPLTICGGRGWQELLGERKNVTYLDRIDFEALPLAYQRAKVVLNLNAGNGACERALQAGAAGAAVVSDHSSLLGRLLRSGEEVAFFHRGKPEEAAVVAGRLLENDAAAAMGARAEARIEAAGLWRHRAEQIVELLRRA
jgi:hypothetical protein